MSPAKRHWIANRRLELAVAMLGLVGGFVLLYDAYDGRGIKPPWFFGPFKPW